MSGSDYDYMFAVAEAMQRYGGSFAKAIAEAWFRADNDNRKKLERCFFELFEEYESFVDWDKYK